MGEAVGHYRNPLSQIQRRLFIPSCSGGSSMARRANKMNMGNKNAGKRTGRRTLDVQNSPQQNQETYVTNEELDGSESEGHGYENNTSRRTSEAASPGHDETLDDDESSEMCKTRGPNRGMDVPENIEDRPSIFTIGGRFPDTTVTSDISVTIKGNFEDAWPTWRAVPKSIKDLYWEKFTKHFKWPAVRHCQIYKAWCKTSSERFRDILCAARKRAKKLSGKKKAKDWIDLNPQWMNSAIWNKLIRDFWSKDKWQKQSDAGTKNRLNGNEKASPTYTGGSIPISAHKYRMKKELKRNPTELELFDRTHKTDDGEYVSAKAKKVRERYDAIIGEKYPELESRPDFDHTAWIEASEGLSKKIVYGFGPTKRAIGMLGNGCDSWTYGEGSLDHGALEDILKSTTEDCKKDVVAHVSSVLPNLVCDLLQHLRREGSKIVHEDDLEDESSDSYASSNSDEDDFDEIDMQNSRRHRIYAKQKGKKSASGKRKRDDEQPTSKKKKIHKNK